MTTRREPFTGIHNGGSRSVGGRVCQEPECETRLSVYNEQDFCSLHAPMVVPRMRGRVLPD